jgi:hypothetical protein
LMIRWTFSDGTGHPQIGDWLPGLDSNQRPFD